MEEKKKILVNLYNPKEKQKAFHKKNWLINFTLLNLL